MKKIVKNLSFMLAMIVCAFSLVGCFNKEYSITVETVTNGTVTVDKQKAKEGEEITITVTPNKDYKIGKVTVNGKSATCSKENICKADMPGENASIKASIISSDQYNITIKSVTNGKIEAEEDYSVAGSDVTLTITPDEGYDLESLLINEEEKISDYSNGSLTFVMPQEDVIVKGVFSEKSTVNQNRVQVTFQSSSDKVTINNGYTSPRNYAKGDQIDLSSAFNVSEGYFIDSYVVNGVTVNNSFYTVSSEDMLVTINVIEGVKVTYTGVTHASPIKAIRYYKPNSNVNFVNAFNLDEGYVVSNYVVNGANLAEDKSSYNLASTAINVSLKVEKGIKVTYRADEYSTPVKGYIYHKKESIITLDDKFNIEDNHYFDYYIISTNKHTESTYLLGTTDVIIELKTFEGVEVTFDKPKNGNIKAGIEETVIYRKGETFDSIDSMFVPNDDYEIKYCLINGEKDKDCSYDIGTEDITVSVYIVEIGRVTFVSAPHAPVKDSCASGLRDVPNGVEISLNCFDIEEGYIVENYILDEEIIDWDLIEDNRYKSDGHAMTFSVVVVQGATVTFTTPKNGSKISGLRTTIDYKKGTTISINVLFKADEDHEIAYCLVDGEEDDDCKYVVDTTDVELSVYIPEIVKFITAPNVKLKNGCKQVLHLQKGDTFSVDCFEPVEGYFIEYYLVNEEVPEGDNFDETKTVTFTGEHTEVAVVLGNAIHVSYEPGDNATTNVVDAYVNPKETSYVQLDVFTPKQGYEIDYYTVNGEKQTENIYELRPTVKEVVVSVVLKAK